MPAAATSAGDTLPAGTAGSTLWESESTSGAGLFPVTVREVNLPDNIRQLLSAHLDFLHTTGQLSVRDMMGPLREYAQVGWADEQPCQR